MSFFSDFNDAAGLVGGAVEAGGNLLASNELEGGADAQLDSANAYLARANGVNALAKEIYGQQRHDLKQYRNLGKRAHRQLFRTYVSGADPYQASPGYQFQRDEGAKALERGAAARGRQFSGRQSKDLVRFGQNVAASDYGRNFNRLAHVAGIGQQAVGAGNAAGAQYVNNATNVLGNVGNALFQAGNARNNAARARASGFAGVGSGINSGINNQLAYDVLEGL